MYFTDRLSNYHLQHDCFYYYVQDDIAKYYEPSESPHQIIPYCIRFEDNDSSFSNYSLMQGTSVTFEVLRMENVTSQQLIDDWWAPIDLAEHYQFYINDPNASSPMQLFYKCKLPWFGPMCKYTFESSAALDTIVRFTFRNKFTLIDDILGITNHTCYMHLHCDRGAKPACLDWREICDGKRDCVEGEDEWHCFEMEQNECADDEYRCHNGFCIPVDFLHDNSHNPDCLDRTDEIQLDDYPSKCMDDPAFRCEEHVCRQTQQFACGDGQCALDGVWCSNNRDTLLTHAMLSREGNIHLSQACWEVMICVTKVFTLFYDIDCDNICGSGNIRCENIVRESCPSVFIFPKQFVTLGYVRFGYANNRSNVNGLWIPDFICYDEQQCDFLPATISINDLSCRRFSEFGLGNKFAGWENIVQAVTRIFLWCSTTPNVTRDSPCPGKTLFRCANSSKCISKHRLVDGVRECFRGDDELYNSSCSLNQKHRFECFSEYKCIASVAVRDGRRSCLDSEDEEKPEDRRRRQHIAFSTICDGFQEREEELLDGRMETDETNCPEQWPCNNQYTRCDDTWNCRNGADELNCRPSRCNSNEQPCVSPITGKIICLPLAKAGDSIVDCLGASDERSLCRTLSRISTNVRYRCWNESECITAQHLCNNRPDCSSGDDERFCESHPSYSNICASSWMGNLSESEDVFCRLNDNKKQKIVHFSLRNAIWYPNVESTVHSQALLAKSQLHRSPPIVPMAHVTISRPTRSIDYLHYAWHCNRGILVKKMGTPMQERCLCPPGYYGNRCQYQSQRVSLTIQFRKESAPDWRVVFHIVLTLIDEENNRSIQSNDHIIYIPIHDCSKKFNIYLLYQTRSENTSRAFGIHIDAFNKSSLAYHASWYLKIPFQFLPVNRLVTQLTIPGRQISSSSKCALKCVHGICQTFMNTEQQFCRCFQGWSGALCSKRHKCNCSPHALCVGAVHNRSICVCPLDRFGPRCLLLRSVCQPNPCKNNGLCASADERENGQKFTCICLEGSSGANCENIDARVDISFRDLSIPPSVLLHLITVSNTSGPTRTTMFKRIAFDRNFVTFFTSIPFHIVLTQFSDRYYLTLVQGSYLSSAIISTEVISSNRCAPINEFFNATFLGFALLRRLKYYHVPCQETAELACFYDEKFMCLCNRDRHANCFEFDHNMSYNCQGNSHCENKAQCFQDHPSCPKTSICVCAACFYGTRCQFTTKGFGLSLDAILGYHIYPNVVFSNQPSLVKMTVGVTTLFLILALINGALSSLTFGQVNPRQVGCGIYLLTSSITSMLTMIVFTLKVTLLIRFQMAFITHRSLLLANCITMDALLKILLTAGDWLNACVAIERVLTVLTGVNFDKAKSKQVAKWIIFFVFVLVTSTALHDPIHRHLIEDEDGQRIWCIVRYSSNLDDFNTAMNMLHFLGPFLVNFVSALLIIMVMARKRSTAQKQLTYSQHLKAQFYQHKQLLISPCILVILAVPRLVLSLIPGCMTSPRNPEFYIASYFVSFIPPILTFVVFVLPSETYKKDFDASQKRLRKAIRELLHIE